MRNYKRLNFGLYNDDQDPVYSGFYIPENGRWNGWLNPYVTKEVFDKIINDIVPKKFNPNHHDQEFWLDFINQKPNKDNLYFVGCGICWVSENDL